MRFSVAAVLLISSVLLAGEASAALIGSTQGYVIYKITLNSQQTQAENFTLNETVQPTSQSGFVQMTITIQSSIRNVTYSNVVNSSSFPEIFPYLVGLNNQSISYGTNGMIDIVHVQNTGSAQVTFNGKTYEGTSYQVSVSATSSAQALEISGNAKVVTLPSGLVYSVQLQNITGNSVNAQLVQTNLPVTVATGSSLPVGLALISIGLLGAIAFAVPSIFIRWRKKPGTAPAPSIQPQTDEKPSYWVD
jgi:hypothetical protein